MLTQSKADESWIAVTIKEVVHGNAEDFLDNPTPSQAVNVVEPPACGGSSPQVIQSQRLVHVD